MSGNGSALHPVAVITGASSGIGAALAREFARRGHRLALVARREDRLAALADMIAASGTPRPLVLPMDVTAAGASRQLATTIAEQGLEPQYIVNNAGFGLLGEAATLDRGEQLAMIDLNIRVLADLSLAFVDSLSRHRGGILNLGSVAGFMPGPGMAVYYASKAFVLSFSEALHQELAPRGIRVTVLCPGPVPTEFQDRAGMASSAGGALLNLSADKIAAAGYTALMRGQRVVVPGLANKFITIAPSLVPRKFFVRSVARSLLSLRRPVKSS